jgi:hypothetical protein
MPLMREEPHNVDEVAPQDNVEDANESGILANSNIKKASSKTRDRKERSPQATVARVPKKSSKWAIYH